MRNLCGELMKMLITGGCKNGKSLYAQKLINKLADRSPKYYIATMQPSDNEDIARIKNHQLERDGWGFITVEQPKDIIEVIEKCEKNSSALLDSTTALLMNEMFASTDVFKHAYRKISKELTTVCSHFSNLVVVSDYIHSDAINYGELTEQYRFGLAKIDRHLARELDVVCEVSFGNLIFHKGVSEHEADCWRSLSR